MHSIKIEDEFFLAIAFNHRRIMESHQNNCREVQYLENGKYSNWMEQVKIESERE